MNQRKKTLHILGKTFEMNAAELKPAMKKLVKRKEEIEQIDIARLMVTQIANKYIVCDTKWEGMNMQRAAYVEAERTLNKFIKWCKLNK